MATLETSARNAMAAAFGNLFASGSEVVFQTSGDAEVAALPMASTPWGSPSSGVITAGAITADTNAAGGTIAKAALMDATPTKQATLTVSTTSGDIVITTLTIAPGSTVSMSSLTATMPA